MGIVFSARRHKIRNVNPAGLGVGWKPNGSVRSGLRLVCVPPFWIALPTFGNSSRKRVLLRDDGQTPLQSASLESTEQAAQTVLKTVAPVRDDGWLPLLSSMMCIGRGYGWPQQTVNLPSSE